MRTDARPLLLLDVCRCGHTREAHGHFRSGTDCGVCRCARFRKPRRWFPW